MRLKLGQPGNFIFHKLFSNNKSNLIFFWLNSQDFELICRLYDNRLIRIEMLI